MKNSRIRPADWAYTILSCMLIIIGIILIAIGPIDPIGKDQICTDLVSIIDDTSNPRSYVDMFSRAYLVVREDSNYEIYYSQGKIEAEVWIPVSMDPGTNVWVCLSYDATDNSHRHYEMYDYGYTFE